MGRFRPKNWRPFEEAREYVRSLGIRTSGEWREYTKSGKRPADIPTDPKRVYRDEWAGMGDWLGTGHRAPGSGWRDFEEAREFVRSLGLDRAQGWNEYSRSGRKPPDIPSTPHSVYAGRGWVSYENWTGTERWRPFEES